MRFGAGGKGYNGGGGGWYGGYGCYSSPSYGGAGGSGFVFCDDTKNSVPSKMTLSTTDVLTEATLIAGNQTMPSPDGKTCSGKLGNGNVKLTRLQ